MNEVNTRSFIYSREDVEKLIVDDLLKSGKITKGDLHALEPIKFETVVFGKNKLHDTYVTIEKVFDREGNEIFDKKSNEIVIEDLNTQDDDKFIKNSISYQSDYSSGNI